MPERLTVLGTDQGLANCGFAVISGTPDELQILESGVVVTDSKRERDQRIHDIYGELSKVVRRHPVQAIGGEKLFYNPPKNRKENRSVQIMNVNMVSGVLCVIAGEHGIRYRDFTPGSIRLSVAGHGRADEKMLKEAISHLTGDRKMPKHEIDAIAAGIHLLCTLWKEQKEKEERKEEFV